MGNRTGHREAILLKECLSGSEKAWSEFYVKYVGLVRSVVRRQAGFSPQDVEDVAQTVFMELIPALKTFDTTYSLPRFICMVTERACIQEYRRRATAKRNGKTDPIDHHDSGEEGTWKLASDLESQEDHLARSELLNLLRRAFRSLDAGCRELLKLRYYEGMPYKEISKILGATENTLTVRSKRCLGHLRATCHELEGKVGE